MATSHFPMYFPSTYCVTGGFHWGNVRFFPFQCNFCCSRLFSLQVRGWSWPFGEMMHQMIVMHKRPKCSFTLRMRRLVKLHYVRPLVPRIIQRILTVITVSTLISYSTIESVTKLGSCCYVNNRQIANLHTNLLSKEKGWKQQGTEEKLAWPN